MESNILNVYLLPGTCTSQYISETVVAGKDSVASTSMCRKQPKMWNLHDALESRKFPLDQDSLTVDSVLNDTAARKSMSHLSSPSPKRLQKTFPNAPNCICNENALDYPTMMIERPIGMMIERPIDRFASLHNSTQAQSTSRCKIRSKNIPIKESHSIDGLPSLNNSMEQVYDFATWRMYHRIANARAMNEEQSSVNKQRNLGCLKKAKRCATMRSESIQAPDLIPVSSPEETPLLDGEVFHLDI